MNSMKDLWDSVLKRLSHELSEGVVEKLKLMTDAEFAELEFPRD